MPCGAPRARPRAQGLGPGSQRDAAILSSPLLALLGLACHLFGLTHDKGQSAASPAARQPALQPGYTAALIRGENSRDQVEPSEVALRFFPLSLETYWDALSTWCPKFGLAILLALAVLPIRIALNVPDARGRGALYTGPLVQGTENIFLHISLKCS